MAQVVHENVPRISQILPTVKCSTCGQPVPLADLGDHVCAPLPPPPLPSLQKPPMSPKSPTSLLPQRFQSLVARSATPPHAPAKPEAESLAPSRDPFLRLQPDISHTATLKSANISLPKSPPSPRDRDRPQLPGARTPPPERVATPARDVIPPSLQRIATPSNASRLAALSPARVTFAIPSPDSAAHSLPTRQATISPLARDNPPPPVLQPLALPPSLLPNRPKLNITPPSILQASVRTSSTPSTSRLSIDKSGVSLDKLPPSLDTRRPSLGSPRPSTEQIPSAIPPAPFARPSPSSSSLSIPPPSVPARQPPPPALTLVYPRMNPEIDTKTGGEAGMAGVGRRGFQAAARAAMFAASRSPSHPAQFTTGHRANAPQYLDINATFGHVIRGKSAAITPPLSPNSAHTPSPVSPFPASPVSLGNSTPVNIRSPSLPSPHDATFQHSPVPASDDKALPPFSSSKIRIASPSRSPSPIPNPFERRLSGETVTQSPMPGANMPLPLLDVLKSELEAGNESDDESVYTTHTDLKKDENAPSSPTDSDAGLAYAHDSENDTPVVMPLDIRKSAMKKGVEKVKFPTSGSPDKSHSSGPSRQTSGASSRFAPLTAKSSAGSARSRSVSAATQSTAKSVGALERAMESLIEEGACVSVLASGSVLASIGGPSSSRGNGKPSRSNTVPGPASPEQKPPKLPTRSHTNPSHPHVHSERVGLIGEVARIRNGGSVKRKERICAGCDSKIEDGRWIQMDGGKVLCERCWKNMYLPKCRRCNLPIEKQAVSSRDGQLKGKYHKECFSCHTCQKPFPDKEFYVFDGKPFCAYHYHETNNSLCGAPSCGQPIEGPCAVTHLGKRYHPEHFLCEFDDGCKERLEEYWEVDGQMLCERHAAIVGSHDGDWTQDQDDDDDDDTQTGKIPGADEGRMMKRMTRFIDLGAGGEGEPDIR